jgi:hypothetical protein
MYSNARKVRNLENAFNNAANYFTTNQAQQLILLTRNESDRLALAKLSYNRITDRNNFATIYNVLNSQSSRNELSAWVNAQGGVTYTPVTPVRTPMSASTFNSLYSSVQYTFGLGAKYSKLTDIFNNSSYNMTTDQAERLIRLVSSESNRLQLAKLGYDNLTDPQNVNQMYDMFDRQSSRDELEAYVRTQPTTTPTQYPYGTTYRVPMSETDYGVLYTDISNRFGLGVKYSALTDAFSNTNNYFTVAQSEQLIRLVSLEENRLQLAKLAYARITDPERISDLYDMFASQASVDELRVYISSR